MQQRNKLWRSLALAVGATMLVVGAGPTRGQPRKAAKEITVGGARGGAEEE